MSLDAHQVAEETAALLDDLDGSYDGEATFTCGVLAVQIEYEDEDGDVCTAVHICKIEGQVSEMIGVLFRAQLLLGNPQMADEEE